MKQQNSGNVFLARLLVVLSILMIIGSIAALIAYLFVLDTLGIF